MANKSVGSIEKAAGPNGSAVEDFLTFTNKYEDVSYYVPGEKISFQGLKEKSGLKLIEAKVEDLPPEEDRDEDVYEDNLDAQVCVIIHADSSKYKANDDPSFERLLQDVKNWLLQDHTSSMKILNHAVTSSEGAVHVVNVTVLLDCYALREFTGSIVSSPFYDDVWNKHLNKFITEGVCYGPGKVAGTLRASLQKHIDEMAKNTNVDHHPNSNDIVRDLVHPALYPYIKSVSKLIEKSHQSRSQTRSQSSSEPATQDFWGRKYEDSKFQWLPTPFQITKERKCLISEYINNLDRQLFPDLYKDLESLFEVFLPYFEEVWSYAKAMEFFHGEDDDGDNSELEKVPPLAKKPVSFKSKELQVITKIVEYTLQPGQSYEGVWHAEGMSHENIVMTGIYFLDRDPSIDGGDLRFKRGFTEAERNMIFWQVSQQRPLVANGFASEGFIPLGYFPTLQDQLLVFPNCHIHKIAKMVNTSDKAASRRIVVFFVINPEQKIISTREVEPQQNVITLSSAKSYRLELMSERKYDKEKLNVRDIELCEH